MNKFALAAFFAISLSSCQMPYTPTKCELAGMEGRCNGEVVQKRSIKYYADEEDVIGLQNLTSRVVVYCYTTESTLAETCAQAYENEGFVRFREIPYKTADYDYLKNDTFPSRRWRDGERTPRW